MIMLIDEVLKEVRKTKYPFQKESEFENFTDVTLMDNGKEYKEHKVKFPVAGSMLVDMPLYAGSGIVLVEFPEWAEMNKRAFRYYSKKSRSESLIKAINLAVKNEMELL